MPRNGTIKQEKILKHNKDKYGYLYVVLQNYGHKRTKKVHRLVAEAFIPKIENKREVNHKNGIRADNRVCNLEWATSSENQLHSFYVLKHRIKAVKQYSLQGKFMKKWINAKIAGEELNIISSSIAACCLGRRKTAGGYIWKYEENTEKSILFLDKEEKI